MVTQETVSVESVTREAGKHLAQFVTDFKTALKAGNPISEAITIASAALSDLAPVLTQIPSLVSEAMENMQAEAVTLLLTGADIVKAVKS